MGVRILLLSDASLCANGGGISQTLYNVFCFVDPQDLLFISSSQTLAKLPPTEPFTNSCSAYKFEIIPINRVTGRYRAPFDWINYTFNRYFRSFEKLRIRIREFKPNVVVSCSNSPIGLFMHDKLIEGLNIENVFPYFMDDWMNKSETKWLGKKVHQWTKRILSKNRSWIMISKSLSEILAERYNVAPTRVLEMHNPVDLTNAPIVVPIKDKREYTLAYAGALWPMHFDAFYAFAKGVYRLHDLKKVRLVLFAPEFFWNWRKKDLEPLNVVYGGSIPYQEIHKKLSEADGFLLTSSFADEWYTHSKGSLQTKVTDYLKAQRVIISCGPSYSANHAFLKKWNCGVCIETNDEKLIAEKLQEIIKEFTKYQSFVENGWQSLQNFSKEVVQKELMEFLTLGSAKN